MYVLTRETAQDGPEVEALFDSCFAPGREALSSYRLREGVPPLSQLCRVARDDLNILAGAVRFWPVRIEHPERVAEAVLLGPIAVHPTRQGEGLGALLMEEGIAAARADRWPRILLVGDAPYYARFGFAQVTGVEMPPPTNPARVLGLGDWAGVRGVVRRWGGHGGRINA